MTPRQFNNAMHGFQTHYENGHKLASERARMQAYFSVAPYLKEKTEPEKLWPFSWDKNKVADIKPNVTMGTDLEVLERMKVLHEKNLGIGKKVQ